MVNGNGNGEHRVEPIDDPDKPDMKKDDLGPWMLVQRKSRGRREVRKNVGTGGVVNKKVEEMEHHVARVDQGKQVRMDEGYDMEVDGLVEVEKEVVDGGKGGVTLGSSPRKVLGEIDQNRRRDGMGKERVSKRAEGDNKVQSPSGVEAVRGGVVEKRRAVVFGGRGRGMSSRGRGGAGRGGRGEAMMAERKDVEVMTSKNSFSVLESFVLETLMEAEASGNGRGKGVTKVPPKPPDDELQAIVDAGRI